MKLKNKKTGEIVELCSKQQFYEDKTHLFLDTKNGRQYYHSLAELNEEWEDAPEEPFSKDFYIIFDGEVKHCIWYRERVAACPDDAHAYLGEYGREQIDNLKSVGLYFETKEEAEQAVEKLKAWKRLKEAGFEFGGWTHTPITKSLTGYNLHIKAYTDKLADYMDDLQLLFGGEE